MPHSLRVFVCCLVVETVLPLVVAAQHLDQLGDPLPTGAVARLGTSRLRVRGSVYDAAFHPNGGQLVTSDGEGRVAFWDSRSGRLLHKESTGANFVYQVSFSRNGDRLIAAGDGVIVVWELETGKKLCSLQRATGRLGSADLSPDGTTLVAVDKDGALQFWRLTENGAEQTLRRAGSFVRVQYAPNGEWVLAADEGHLFRVRAGTGEILSQWDAHKGEIEDLDISPEGGQVVSAGDDGVFTVWEAETGNRLWNVEDAHRRSTHSTVNSARYSPDGKTLVTAGGDGIVRFWDVQSHKQIRSFEAGVQRKVRCDAQTLVWSLDPKDWPRNEDPAEITSLKKLWQELGEHEASRAYAAAAKLIETPDATTLLTEMIPEAITLPTHPPYEDADVLRLHRAAYVLEQIGSKEASAIRNRIHYPRLQPKTFDPRKRRFDTFGDPLAEGAVLRLGTDRFYVAGRTARIAFSPDGSCIAVAGNDDMFGDAGRGVAERRNASLELWDPRTGKAIRRIDVPFPGGYPAMPIYTPDGKTIVCVAGKGVWLVDVAEGRIRKQWETDKAIYALTALSSDGRQVVLSHSNSSFRVYETETGISLGGAKLDGRVVSATAAANNIVFVTYRRNVEQELSVWSVEKQEWVRREETPLQKTLAVSPDGRSYAKANRGNLIELRRVSDDKVLSKIELDTEEFHSHYPNRLLFPPDGKHLAAWPDHRVLTLFDTATGKPSSNINCSAGKGSLPSHPA